MENPLELSPRPRALRNLGWTLVGLGALSFLNLIYDLLAGNQITIDVGIVLLPCAGFGLLEGRNGWRIFCLVGACVMFLFLALMTAALFFQPLPDWTSWTIVLLFGLSAAGIAWWTIHVVLRPDVRNYCAARAMLRQRR